MLTSELVKEAQAVGREEIIVLIVDALEQMEASGRTVVSTQQVKIMLKNAARETRDAVS